MFRGITTGEDDVEHVLSERLSKKNEHEDHVWKEKRNYEAAGEEPDKIIPAAGARAQKKEHTL